MNTKSYRMNPNKHNFNLFSKYIDKIEFERKNLPEIFLNRERFIVSKNTPKISFQLAQDNLEGDVYRTIFDINIDYTIDGTDPALGEEKKYEVYTLKIIYIAMTNIENSKTIDASDIRQILLVDVPYLIFPHIEKFIFDILRESGSTPVQINPIDFLSLFEKEGDNQ